MKRKITLASLVLCLISVAALAGVFTDVNSSHYWGRTGLKDLTSTLDSNFELIESGAITSTVGNLVLGGDLTVGGGDINGPGSADIDLGETTTNKITMTASSGVSVSHAFTIGTDLTLTGGDITGLTGCSIDLGEATAGTVTVTGTNITLSGTTKVGTLNGLIKGSTGTLSAATSGTDYLAPGAATFTNTVSATITNLSITVNKGLVTSVTINGSTKP